MSQPQQIESTVLASEISIAKDYSIKSNINTNNLKTKVNQNTLTNNNQDVSLNIIYKKLENLTLLLRQSDISGISDTSLAFINL